MYNQTVLQKGSPIDTAGLVILGHKSASGASIELMVTETGASIETALSGAIKVDLSNILPIAMADTGGHLITTEERALILI